MKKDEIDSYSAIAKNYDKIAKKAVKESAEKILAKLIIKKLQSKATILDLGCGTGLSAEPFFNKNYDVIGVELVPAMFKEAMKRPFKKVICQDVEKKLPLKNIDVVLLIGVLEHIKNPLILLNKINSYLKEKGLFALTVPYKLKKSSKLKIQNYSYKEIENIFHKTGFKILHKIRFKGYNRGAETVKDTGYILQKI